MFRNAGWGRASHLKLSPQPVLGLETPPFPHPTTSGALPSPAVQFSAVFSEEQGKLPRSPLCLLPALQRSRQELSSSVPGAQLCSKVCAVLSPTAPLTLLLLWKCSPLGTTVLREGGFNVRWLHGSSVPPCFPPPLLLVCGGAQHPLITSPPRGVSVLDSFQQRSDLLWGDLF